MILSAQGYRPNQMYKIQVPSGEWLDPPKGRCWGATEPVFNNYLENGRIYFPNGGAGRPRVKQFREDERGLVPMTWWSADFAGDNEAGKKEALVLTPNSDAFGTPKPEELLLRVISVATNPDDIILDSFLGSGTTAAVAHKMGRRWIGIEMGEHARTHCVPRLKKVIEGEQGGVSEAVGWQGGGGFRFLQLGEAVFDELDCINPQVRFAPLAGWLWFAHTRTPHATGTFDSPLLGMQGDTAIVLLFNGILGDKRPQGGNVLTREVWKHLAELLPAHSGRWLVFGEACRLAATTCAQARIDFRQIPRQLGLR